MSRNSRFIRVVMVCLGVLACGTLPAAAQQIQWRHDYDSARAEAKAKNKPLFIDFSTRNCFWCKKLDATTFRDPAVVKTINEQFIPLKMDGERHASLVKFLNIKGFPTLVFAAPTGKVLHLQPGFMNPAQIQQRLQVTLNESGNPNPGGAPPIRLASAEKSVNATVPPRVQQARALLAQAEKEFRTEQYICCLVRCKIIAATFPDLPEAAAAEQLAVKLKSDPQRVQLTCAKLSYSLCELYLEVAQAWLEKGDSEKAAPYLQWIVQACPNSPFAGAAQQRLQQLASPQVPPAIVED